MKIYFAGSMRGGRDDVQVYLEIIHVLKEHGEVLTEHVGNPNITGRGEGLPESWIFERDIGWLSSCDALVAEVSTPSTGVGYEICLAIEKRKPVLCLYRRGSEKPLSAMIAGNPGAKVAAYSSIEEARAAIGEFFSVLAEARKKI